MYKLVASDVDGTLNNDLGHISAENVLAIEKLYDMGIQFVPATGRTLSEMGEVLSIPQVRYIIYSNGSVIYDRETETNTYMCISKEVAKGLLDMLATCECYIVIHHGGNTYEKPYENYEELKRYNISAIIHGLLEKYGTKVENFDEFAYTLDNIESIAVFFGNDEDEKRCKDFLENVDAVFYGGAWPHNVEIFSAEAGKEKALKKLADKIGVKMEEILALGDSDNDREMLEMAGYSLCASNGTETAKKVADEIMCSNNEHVVNYALNKVIMQQKEEL